jgi:2-polyprenyl-3-methyl-5-hydroxy-6-metoxy-1,4-benzoquinol methylase
LAWPQPLPTFEDLREIYESDSLKHQYAQAGETTYVAGSESAADYIVERVDHMTATAGTPGKVLDIGAAQGAFLKACRDRGWETTGIELSPEGRDYAKTHHGMEFDSVPLEDLRLPAGSFDAVHMNHVLEHLVDPRGTLREIHRVLRPGGQFIVEVPNEIDDLFVQICSAIGRPPKPYPVPSPHIYHFNAPSLKRVLENAGFSVTLLVTPRRNLNYNSRIPLGSLVRRTIFGLEAALKKGPVILAYCRKP